MIQNPCPAPSPIEPIFFSYEEFALMNDLYLRVACVGLENEPTCRVHQCQETANVSPTGVDLDDFLLKHKNLRDALHRSSTGEEIWRHFTRSKNAIEIVTEPVDIGNAVLSGVLDGAPSASLRYGLTTDVEIGFAREQPDLGQFCIRLEGKMDADGVTLTAAAGIGRPGLAALLEAAKMFIAKYSEWPKDLEVETEADAVLLEAYYKSNWVNASRSALRFTGPPEELMEGAYLVLGKKLAWVLQRSLAPSP